MNEVFGRKKPRPIIDYRMTFTMPVVEVRPKHSLTLAATASISVRPTKIFYNGIGAPKPPKQVQQTPEAPKAPIAPPKAEAPQPQVALPKVAPEPAESLPPTSPDSPANVLESPAINPATKPSAVLEKPPISTPVKVQESPVKPSASGRFKVIMRFRSKIKGRRGDFMDTMDQILAKVPEVESIYQSKKHVTVTLRPMSKAEADELVQKISSQVKSFAEVNTSIHEIFRAKEETITPKQTSEEPITLPKGEVSLLDLQKQLPPEELQSIYVKNGAKESERATFPQEKA